MIRVILFILLASCASTVVFAAGNSEDYDYMTEVLKKKNPNTISYFVDVADDCPFDTAAAAEIVRGVLIRSRVKPMATAESAAELYLHISIDCLENDGFSETYVFNNDVYFAQLQPVTPVLFPPGFGGFGRGDSEYVLESLRMAAERAVTAYLLANFDLSD